MKRLLLCSLLCALLLFPLPTAHAAQLRLTAQLLEDGTSTPLTDAAVTLSPTGRTGRTDECGTLTFSHLAPGAYTLRRTGAGPTQPVALLRNEDGSCTVSGQTVDAISLVYPSPHRAVLAAGVILSLIPMVLRLWWLQRKN